MLGLDQDLGRLVSDTFSTDPSGSNFSTDPSGCSHTYDASTKQQQSEAAAVLSGHSNEDIIAWLKLARSARKIEPIGEQCPGTAHISPLQIHALSALKDCPNDRILGCLELARRCRDDTNIEVFECGAAIEPGLGNDRSSLFGKLESSTSLWTNAIKQDSSQGGLNLSSRTFTTDNLSGHHAGRSINSNRSKNAENHYWCTVCEEPNSYKDSGSWKKHEKEHETTFVCEMGDTAASGREDQDHASRAFTSKRRDLMVNHLNKSHGILETNRARDLADQWRHTAKKQAWGCGFCSSLFSTFQDRLKHIDVEHFRSNQSIQEWDLNKVILALLQQPRMKRAWKTIMASMPPRVHQGSIAWNKAIAKDLQATLERGPSDDHHARTLAEEAYFGSESNGAPWHQNGAKHVNYVSDATPEASFLSSPNHYPVTSAAISYARSYYRPSSTIKDDTARLPCDDSSFIGAPTGTFALNNTIEPAMISLNDNGCADYNAAFFDPSQSWASAPDPENLFNDYGQLNSYAC